MIPFCHLGVSQWVGALPPPALDLDFPALEGEETEEIAALDDDEELEEQPTDFRGALAATAEKGPV